MQLHRRSWGPRGPGPASRPGLLLAVLACMAADGQRTPEQEIAALRAQQKLQEAEWRLRRQGSVARADQLRAELLARLAHGRILEVKQLGGNTLSTLRKVELEGGISGIFKPEGGTRRPGGDQAPRKEVAAWRLDQLLELGRVPLTVEREVGGERGSLQYFVRDVRTATSLGKKRPAAVPTIRFLDALLANWDRQPGNLLIDADGRQIAIDHNLAFDEERFRWPADGRVLVPSRRVYRNLKQLADEPVRSALEGLVLPGELDALLRRKHRLVALLDRVTQNGTLEARFEKE